MKLAIRLSTLLFAYLSLFIVSAYAQGGMTVVVNAPKQAIVGEGFYVTYTLATDVAGSRISLADANGFDVITGPVMSQTTEAKASGGDFVTQVSTKYTYFYRSNKVGGFMIPICQIKTPTGTYQSGARLIQIVARESTSQKTQQTSKLTTVATAQTPSRPSASDDDSDYAESVVLDDDDIFVDMRVSSVIIDETETIKATVKLYSVREISSFVEIDSPTFHGFEVNTVDRNANMQLNDEVIGEKKYHVFFIAEYMLRPLRTGKLEIGEGHYRVEVVRDQKQAKTRHSSRKADDTASFSFFSNPVSVEVYKAKNKSVDENIVSDSQSDHLKKNNSGKGEIAKKDQYDSNFFDSLTIKQYIYGILFLIIIFIVAYILIKR